MFKVTNIIYTKNFNNIVQPIVLKIDNVMFLFIKRKFINMLAKNTAKYILEKKKNIGIMKTYYLNILPIVIIY